ncbi:MAG: hypothetical protein ACAH21_13140 [Ramlibacter sp.]
MNPDDPNLANWLGLYDQLSLARMRLKEAPAEPDLQDEVRRLTRMAGVALDRISQEQQAVNVPAGRTA